MLNNSELKILIVDDEVFNIEVVMGFLEDEGYQFNYTTNGKDALKAIFSNHFDLILLDINMPEMDGLEVCKRIKNDEKTKDIPIIFLSAFNDIDTITKAFSAGGTDYITKPFNGLELIARVQTHIKLQKYIYELKVKQEKLAQLASTDIQTGLPNRLRFIAVLKKELKTVTSNPSRLSLAYIKIDHLQKINNILGYKNADKVLIKMARTLQESIKDEYMVTRLFSADFVVLMPNTSLELATHQIKKSYEDIKKMKLPDIALTCSIGITEYIKDDTSDAFILKAEKIMESIKHRGGDRISTQILN